MQKTIKYLFAAVALVAAAACQKEDRPQESNEKAGGRILVATFAANEDGTKTTVDGMSPKWSDGDKILLTDGKPEDEGQPIEDPNSVHNRIFTLKNNDTVWEELEAQILDGGNSFQVLVPSTFESPLYAIYPADAFVTMEGGKMKFNIRAAEMNHNPTDPDYEENPQTGTFSNANICVAKAEGDMLPFKNATSIIKIEGRTPGVKAIMIRNDSQVIAGHFSYDFSEDRVEATEGSKSITAINLPASGPCYIAIAPVTLPAGTEFIFMDNGPKVGGTAIGTKRTSADKALGRSKIYNIGYAMDGVLPGAFSVSDTKKVFFSKGNLQAHIETDGTPSGWKFAENQYTYLGTAGANTAIGSGAGDIDLFDWSSTATNSNWGIHSVTDAEQPGYFSADFKDWGTAYCTANSITPTTLWRTLSKNEWKWLINERACSTVSGTENARYAKVKVGGIYGLLLFPDVFTWAEGAMGTSPNHINDGSVGWSDVSAYTAVQFAEIQDAGAVFLPAAGSRTGLTVSLCNTDGYYWSSTYASSIFSYSLYFRDSSVSGNSGKEFFYGCSVRLVTE